MSHPAKVAFGESPIGVQLIGRDLYGCGRLSEGFSIPNPMSADYGNLHRFMGLV
jgi:hypothetical protein